MLRFSADVVFHTQQPDFITLRLQGEVNISTLDQVEKALTPLLAKCRGKRIVFDLTGVSYVSSSGWSLFLSAYQQIRSQGGSFLLTGMNTEVTNTFEILEFSFIDHYPDLESAIRICAPLPVPAAKERGRGEKPNHAEGNIQQGLLKRLEELSRN